MRIETYKAMNANYNIRIILSLGFILFYFLGNAQTSDHTKFLKNIGIADSIYSETLSEYRKIYIQYPDNYTSENKEKYPVVYILDGEALLPTVSNFQSFYSGGFTPEMLLIGISNGNHRTRDLTTSKITENYGMPYNEENGAAHNFTKFIETELIPYVENKYPVTNFRTLIGHSYGGLFTINTLVNHPHLFTNYLAIDPSLDWDQQKLISNAEDKISNVNYKGKSLFMSLNGQLNAQDTLVTINNVMKDTSDFTLFARSNIKFSKIIDQKAKDNLSFEWKFYPQDLHGTIAYPSIMDGLLFQFKWFQMENTAKFNTPSTSKKELQRIITYRSEKLETHFGYPVPPYPEELLNALGYMSLDMEQLDKSKMFFEFALQFYPNSANAFDSISEYYERIGDFQSALKFATKANELNSSDYYKQRVTTLKEKL